MPANFNTFLVRMTGPARLRNALCESTRPLFNLLTAVNGPGSVKTKLPLEVLGGDIFGLMSNRLRHLLEVPTPVEKTINKSRRTGQTSLEDFVHRESLKSLVTHDASVHKSDFATDSYKGQLDSRRRFTPEPVWFGPHGPKDPQLSSLMDGASETVFPLPSTSAEKSFPFGSALSESLAHYKQDGNAGPVLLEKKLRQYWELNQPGGSDRRNLLESSSAGTLTQPSVADFSAPLGFTPASRPWSELVGRELSKKARTAGSQFPGDISRSTSKRSAEKVEIQNVFNIEVKNEASGVHGLDDLSEKITEILNEQALQHGIDVT